MENAKSKYVVWAHIRNPDKEVVRESFDDKTQAVMFYDKLISWIETEHLKGHPYVDEIIYPSFKTEQAYVELDVEPNFEGRSQMLEYKYFYAYLERK